MNEPSRRIAAKYPILREPPMESTLVPANEGETEVIVIPAQYNARCARVFGLGA